MNGKYGKHNKTGIFAGVRHPTIMLKIYRVLTQTYDLPQSAANIAMIVDEDRVRVASMLVFLRRKGYVERDKVRTKENGHLKWIGVYRRTKRDLLSDLEAELTRKRVDEFKQSLSVLHGKFDQNDTPLFVTKKIGNKIRVNGRID